MASFPTKVTLLQEELAETIPSSSFAGETSPLLPSSSDPETTILYLAYGSNLCSETFLGKRGIKPLSSIAVHVPSLTLTFDLPGVPYLEPCFANTKYRNPDSDSEPEPETTTSPVCAATEDSPYHKDRWHKGLVGVVYEVTIADYRTIIATEGGGASYQDVLVECYALSSGADSLENGLNTEGGKKFKAHTLLAPRDEKSNPRPDPSYAQPSARYLGLITSGADEHALPVEYQKYLRNIRPYTITTSWQKVGKTLFMAAWMPMIIVVFGLGRLFADKEGRIPPWLAGLMTNLFKGIWWGYDKVLKGVFGDGERTIGDGGKADGAVRLGDDDLEKCCVSGSGQKRGWFWRKKSSVEADEGVRS